MPYLHGKTRLHREYKGTAAGLVALPSSVQSFTKSRLGQDTVREGKGEVGGGGEGGYTGIF